MAKGRPRRKSLRNVSNCDVCERRGPQGAPRARPPCPCVRCRCVSAVSQTRVQGAARGYPLFLYGVAVGEFTLFMILRECGLQLQCPVRELETWRVAREGGIPRGGPSC